MPNTLNLYQISFTAYKTSNITLKIYSKNLIRCACIVNVVHNLVIHAIPSLKQEIVNNNWLVSLLYSLHGI